jgi:hypothetical protein
LRLGDLIRLERCAGRHYWLDVNAGDLRSRETLLNVEPLQPKFVAATMPGAGQAERANLYGSATPAPFAHEELRMI